MSITQAVNAQLLKTAPLPRPGENTDKDSRGRVLIAGGSALSAGAIVLSGVAALRAGAGKVMLAVPRSLSLAIAVGFPEAGVTGFPVTTEGGPAVRAASKQISTLLPHVDSFLLGPGMADENSAQKLAEQLLNTNPNGTFIVDAMCLTGLWDHHQTVVKRDGSLIVTPHPGEMAALTGLSKERVNQEPISVAIKVAAHLRCIVILKGSSTVIAQPGGPTYLYEGGGVGLATSGSGDVLAGVLAGLVARGAAPIQAAIWSVFLHGEAGRRLAARIGPLGFLAREIPDEVPKVMAELGES